MIRAVAFDVGGVLTSSPVEEFTKVDDEHGLRPGTVQGFFRGGKVFAEVETGRMPVLEFHRRTVDDIRANHGVTVPVERLELMLENCMGSKIQTDMLNLVTEVKAAGYQTALITNIFAERRLWLHSLFAEGVIDVYCDSSEVGLRKPDPAIYVKLLKMLNRKAGEVAFIDDFSENLLPARDMGMTGILFTNPAQARADLVAAGVQLFFKPMAHEVA